MLLFITSQLLFIYMRYFKQHFFFKLMTHTVSFSNKNIFLWPKWEMCLACITTQLLNPFPSVCYNSKCINEMFNSHFCYHTCDSSLVAALQLAAFLQLKSRWRRGSAPASPPTVSVVVGRITAAKLTRQPQESPASGGTPSPLIGIPSSQTHTSASEYFHFLSL